MGKITKSWKIKTDKELMKYCFKLIKVQAKKNNKDVYDLSLEDIYQALSKGRNKFPKTLFKTKISTFIKGNKWRSHFMDSISLASFNPLVYISFAGRKIISKLFGKKIKKMAKNMGIVYMVDYIAKESYKTKKTIRTKVS